MFDRKIVVLLLVVSFLAGCATGPHKGIRATKKRDKLKQSNRYR